LCVMNSSPLGVNINASHQVGWLPLEQNIVHLSYRLAAS